VRDWIIIRDHNGKKKQGGTNEKGCFGTEGKVKETKPAQTTLRVPSKRTWNNKRKCDQKKVGGTAKKIKMGTGLWKRENNEAKQRMWLKGTGPDGMGVIKNFRVENREGSSHLG